LDGYIAAVIRKSSWILPTSKRKTRFYTQNGTFCYRVMLDSKIPVQPTLLDMVSNDYDFS
jgi:hypothetical protein